MVFLTSYPLVKYGRSCDSLVPSSSSSPNYCYLPCSSLTYIDCKENSTATPLFFLSFRYGLKCSSFLLCTPRTFVLTGRILQSKRIKPIRRMAWMLSHLSPWPCLMTLATSPTDRKGRLLLPSYAFCLSELFLQVYTPIRHLFSFWWIALSHLASLLCSPSIPTEFQLHRVYTAHTASSAISWIISDLNIRRFSGSLVKGRVKVSRRRKQR